MVDLHLLPNFLLNESRFPAFHEETNYLRSKIDKLEKVNHCIDRTLTSLSTSGIYDHITGGFFVTARMSNGFNHTMKRCLQITHYC